MIVAAEFFCLQVKLLDKLMHHMAEEPQQQVVLLSQVLAAEVNIGYEEMLNTQVRPTSTTQQ
jgi:apolipoprotein N-acyltransferase